MPLKTATHEMSVTVIIPTTAEAARASSLRRAMLSVVDQLSGDGLIIVVANGERVDDGVLGMVETFPRTRIERLPAANVAQAQQRGRNLVATEFFCFLDDDDEYLPDAFQARMQAFQADPAADVVVTNGFKRIGSDDVVVIERPGLVQSDPLRALADQNWLASCAALFRTSSVNGVFFDGRSCFFEWTLLAYKLALARVIRFTNVPTYRIHSSPGSASKSRTHLEMHPGALATIAALDLPRDVRRAVLRKISDAEHHLSEYFLRGGEWRRAAHHHLRSLTSPGGLKFLPYTRKLLWPQSVTMSKPDRDRGVRDE